MTDRLFVRLLTRGIAKPHTVEGEEQSVPSPKVQWALFRNDQLLSGPGECSLSEVIEQLPETIRAVAIPNPNLKVIAVVPGEAVSLNEVILPSSQAKVNAKALPFMLEDSITEDLDLVHFALGAKLKNKATNVAIVNGELLQYWVDLLKESGLQPEILIPDVLLLPSADNVWTVMFDGNRGILRTEGSRGLSFLSNQMATVLGITLDDAMSQEGFADETTTIRFIYESDNEEAEMAVNLIETELAAMAASDDDNSYPVVVERDIINNTSFEALCSNLCTSTAEKGTLNLLQGKYKQEISRMGANIKWQPVAALMMVWMFIFLGGEYGQGYYYNLKADALEQETRDYYKQLFPGTKKVRRVKKSMEKKIKEAGKTTASVGFVPLLGSTGQFIHDLNKKKKETVLLQRITFDEKQGNLRVDMRISDFTVLETLKNQIQNAGLTVTIDAATKEADKVKARLRIQG